MRGKFLMVLGLFLAVILVAGCLPTKDTDTTEGPFLGGHDGVNIQFMTAAPPSTITQGTPVQVKVELRNAGETDLNSGEAKVRLFGVDLIDYNLPDTYIATQSILRGKGDLYPDGGTQEIFIGDLQYDPNVVNQEQATIRAKVCYPYQTQVKAKVCMKSATAQEAGGIQTCSISGNKITKGTVSSAPIQVTSLTEEHRGSDQVKFSIVIENVGNGRVYGSEIICEDTEDDFMRMNNEDKIRVEVKSPTGAVCSFNDGEGSSGIIELDDSGRTTLNCLKTVNDVYEKTMDVLLDYLYVEDTSKQIVIYESTPA